jgi:sec-independent protein translocase protein TatB
VVAIVALLVIGPKDLPRAMHFVGKWFGKARAVARQFRSGFDNMVREAELAEMEKQWAAENERIMREHPAPASIPSLLDDGYETEPAARSPAKAEAPEEGVAAPAPRALPSARPPEEIALEAEPSAEPVRRLRRGSELDDGSVP